MAHATVGDQSVAHLTGQSIATDRSIAIAIAGPVVAIARLLTLGLPVPDRLLCLGPAIPRGAHAGVRAVFVTIEASTCAAQKSKHQSASSHPHVRVGVQQSCLITRIEEPSWILGPTHRRCLAIGSKTGKLRSDIEQFAPEPSRRWPISARGIEGVACRGSRRPPRGGPRCSAPSPESWRRARAPCPCRDPSCDRRRAWSAARPAERWPR